VDGKERDGMPVRKSRTPSQDQAKATDVVEGVECVDEDDEDEDADEDVEETRASAVVAQRLTGTVVVSLSRVIPGGSTPVEEGKEKEMELQQGVPLGVNDS
jgi:hypothetical protein